MAMDMCVLSASLTMAECTSGVPMSRLSRNPMPDTASSSPTSCVSDAYISTLDIPPKDMDDHDRSDQITLKGVAQQQ